MHNLCIFAHCGCCCCCCLCMRLEWQQQLQLKWWPLRHTKTTTTASTQVVIVIVGFGTLSASRKSCIFRQPRTREGQQRSERGQCRDGDRGRAAAALQGQDMQTKRRAAQLQMLTGCLPPTSGNQRRSRPEGGEAGTTCTSHAKASSFASSSSCTFPGRI